MTGTVYLIGAGPGAPDLLTLRAARVLERADIVFHDALVHPETLALAVRAEKVETGKRSGRRSTAQKFINKRLIDAARKHDVVVRLKGGDPMLFGRVQEEIEALRAGHIPFQIVPGVTAASAAAAQIGVSLTRRGLSRHVTFVTPRAAPEEPANDWAASVLAADTAVIYMGAGLAQSIADTLIARGKPADTPVGLVEDASLPGSRVRYGMLRDLAPMAALCGAGPAVIILGDVLRETMQQDAVESLVFARLPHRARA